jgi:DNA polymerase-3 subunit epsilon
MKTTVIFFDTETNGLSANDSVLSISAIKCLFSDENGLFETQVQGEYERYYFRKKGEAFGKGAVDVNGLTDEVIKEKRADAKYPLCFHEDTDAFLDFCGGAKHFCAHNIAYDRKYLPFNLENVFCTMTQNKNVLKLKRKDGAFKMPRLSEAASYYKIKFNTDKLHGSSYDTKILFEIFKKMLENKSAEKMVLKFLSMN